MDTFKNPPHVKARKVDALGTSRKKHWLKMKKDMYMISTKALKRQK